MSKFSFIDRGTLGHSVETSALTGLRSPRESSGPGKNWYRIRTALDRALNSGNSLSLIRQMATRQETGGSDRLHPFKIYPTPRTWVPDTNPAYAWRTFRIRNGLVLTTTAEGITVDGTDQSNLPYNNALFCLETGVPITSIQDYTVPDSTAFFWFWVEVTSPVSAVIRYGPDPSVSSYTDPDSINPSWSSSNPWTTWPAPDDSHIPLGFVDTLTVPNTALPRQYQIHDIFFFKSSAGADTGTNAEVHAIVPVSTTGVVIGGLFSKVNGYFRTGIAAMDLTLSLGKAYWNFATGPVNADPGTQIGIDFALTTDNRIWLMSSGTDFDANFWYTLALADIKGAPDGSFVGGYGINPSSVPGGVSCANVAADNSVIVLDMLFWNGTSVPNIARIDVTGAQVGAFTPGSGLAGGGGFGMSIRPYGSDFLIASKYATYNGTTITNYVIKIDATGALDTTFNSNGSGFTGAPSGKVGMIAVMPSNKIVVSGAGSNGTAVRINSDGTPDGTFTATTNSGGSGPNPVACCAVDGAGKVYIGGNFTTVGGSSRKCLARLNSDGTLDTTFSCDVFFAMATPSVSALQILANGRIVVGGVFDSLGTGPNLKSRDNIALITAEGKVV